MCETESESRTLIDAYAVALDETDHYTIEEADRPYIEKIMGVYLFDRNQRTHCCELTPSYWLTHLYDQVILTEVGRALEELDGFAADMFYQEYEQCASDGIYTHYVHCHSIDALIERNEKLTVHHYGNQEFCDRDTDYDDQMEDIREYLCSNRPF